MDATSARDLAGAWGGDPGVLALLLAATFVYVAGMRRRRHREARRNDMWFAAAMAVLFLALASPIDAGAQHLLWLHMLQHVLLAQVAPPLFVVAAPIATFDAALPYRWRRRMARVAAHPTARSARRLARRPLFAFAAMAAAWWGWHIPAAYDAAVRHAPLHALEHVTLFAVGLLWWNCVLGRHRAPAAQRIALVVATGIHMNVLGALITLAPHQLYTVYTGAYGLSALEDQQLGGVLMWVLGGFVSLGFLVVFVQQLLREEEAPVGAAPLAGAGN